MSISREAWIIVGLRVSDIISQDLIEENDLDTCDPYYDCAEDEEIVAGYALVRTGDQCAIELDFDMAKVDELKKKFMKVIGQEPKLFLSTWTC